MSQTELNAAERFLYAALGELADGRVYRTKAPLKTKWPCIVFGCQQAADYNVVGAKRLAVTALYAVRVITTLPEAAADAVDAIAQAADAAILAASPDETVLAVERDEPLYRAYTIDGIDYEERGGVYRVFLKGG